VPQPNAAIISLTRQSGRPFSTDASHIDVDLGPLIAHLLLSDRIVIKSQAFLEVPALVSAFGLPAVLDLLKSDCVDFYCHYVLVGDMSKGSRSDAATGWGRGPLPPLSFHFGCVQPMHYLDRGLRRVEQIDGLSIADINVLQGALVSRLVSVDERLDRRALEALQDDVAADRPYLRDAVAIALSRRLKREVRNDPWVCRFDTVIQADYAAITNIGDVFGLDPEQVHSVIASGLMAVGELNVTLEQMRQYNGTAELRPSDAALLGSRLAFLLERANSDRDVPQLWRMLALRGVPAVNGIPPRGAVDLRALLAMRDAPEWTDFRQWLQGAEVVGDAELETEFRSLRSRVGRLFSHPAARTIRWLSTKALDMSSTGAGLAAEGLDAFLSNLLQTSRPVTFLNRSVQSVFRNTSLLSGAGTSSKPRG
jgi:hypothetical protein